MVGASLEVEGVAFVEPLAVAAFAVVSVESVVVRFEDGVVARGKLSWHLA